MGDNQDRGAVVITGTSSGIGRCLALQLDELGYQVFAGVRKQTDLERWQSEEKQRLVPIMLDVTDAAGIARARDEVEQSVGAAGLAGLINNAGISFRAPLEGLPLASLRELYDVNVFGAFATTQAFLPMLRRAGGRVLNVSAATSLFITPFHGGYSSSKAALNALTSALRLEVDPLRVRVSVAIVGGVKTDLWEKVARVTKELASRFSPDVVETYGNRQKAALKTLAARGQAGMTSEEAARHLVAAFADEKNRDTYFIGRDARKVRVLNRILGGRLRERFIARRFG